MPPVQAHERCRRPEGAESGHLLVALMVLIAVLMIMLTVTGQSWTFLARRDAEAELIFRGEQYINAIEFYRKETGSFPTDLKLLAQPGPHRHRFIRKLYKDPLAKDGKWGRLYLSPTGKGYINPYATRREQQAFVAGTFGDKGPGRGGFGDTEEDDEDANGGYTELSKEDFNAFGGEQAGMPIVGVVHKTKESGLKIYKNLANLNDWAFTALAEGQQTEFGTAPVAQPPRQRRSGVGDSTSPVAVPSRREIPRADPNYNPMKSLQDKMREKARQEKERREQEQREQEGDNPRHEEAQEPAHDEAPDADDQEDESPDDEQEDEEDDSSDEDPEDPNGPPADPNAPAHPHASQESATPLA